MYRLDGHQQSLGHSMYAIYQLIHSQMPHGIDCYVTAVSSYKHKHIYA